MAAEVSFDKTCDLLQIQINVHTSLKLRIRQLACQVAGGGWTTLAQNVTSWPCNLYRLFFFVYCILGLLHTATKYLFHDPDLDSATSKICLRDSIAQDRVRCRQNGLTPKAPLPMIKVEGLFLALHNSTSLTYKQVWKARFRFRLLKPFQCKFSASATGNRLR